MQSTPCAVYAAIALGAAPDARPGAHLLFRGYQGSGMHFPSKRYRGACDRPALPHLRQPVLARQVRLAVPSAKCGST